jgi:exonuclease SbcC
VLYGPNGFGKTSFFDAIDFAATGEIGRLESSGDAYLKRVAKHLDSGAEESSVSLALSANGGRRKIVRQVSNPKYALLDGRTVDRKTLLGELTAGMIPTADRVEPFVRLFRATHLFSQEHQELARDFQDDCTLSNEVVSRMLAFEDYANAVTKAKRVLQLLETTISGADRDSRELSEQIADETRELDRLRQITGTELPKGVLQSQIKALRRQLKEQGIASEDTDVSAVRGWRAEIELRHADSEHLLARLTISAGEVDGLSAARTETTTLRKQIEEQEAALRDADSKRPGLELELQRARERLAELIAKRAALNERSQLFGWIRTVKPAYTRTVTDAQDTLERVGRLTTAVSDARSREAEAAELLRRDEERLNTLNVELAAARERLAVIDAVIAKVQEWQDAQTSLASSHEAWVAMGLTLEALRKEEEELIAKTAVLDGNEKELRLQIAEVDRNQTELRRLLSQLQGHVDSGVCPLCGEDHVSRDELLRRIQSHVVADAASLARRQLSDAQEESRRVTEQLAANKRGREEGLSRLSTLETERHRLETTIAAFLSDLDGFGIEPGSSNVRDQLRQRRQPYELEESQLVPRVREAMTAVETKRAVVTEATRALRSAERDVTSAQTSLEQLNQEVARLRDDRRLGELSVDIDSDRLDDIERNDLAELATIEVAVTSAEREMKEATRLHESTRQLIATFKSTLPPLRTRLTTLQKEEAEIVARLREAKLSSDVTKRELLEIISGESQKRAHLASLRDAATSIELAFDAASTSAALSVLAKNIRNKDRAVSIAGSSRDKHAPWAKYFQAVVQLVSAEQNEAIDHLTSEYGPRTSIIQRRLRTVYGFDEIEITSRQGTISVGVMRRGMQLRPTDYFSQSQQQTLLLGLFLTACLSQNWSALRPVFLDDPVTHFDDLNTYAFLDLIVGLLESGSEHRQFVLSTCDERFLQLARQKFRHLRDRAKFYGFTAIGPDGPVVQDIST